MKNIITTLSLILFFASNAANAQSLDSIRPLKVGDKVPDILMGEVTNYHKNEMRISDFKGKLLILDFWATTCASCIAAFPKMGKLQSQFEREIQIVLANGYENQEEMGKGLKRRKLKTDQFSLPIVSNAKILRALFPHQGVPHHVWIDKDGIVRLIGAAMNSHEKKIRQLLNGEQIDFVKDGLNAKFFNPKIPISSLVEDLNPPFSTYQSFLSPYNNDFGTYGNSSLNYTDSSTNTVRHTFVNAEILYLFYEILKGNETWENRIIGPNTYKEFDPFLLKVKDTLSYTAHYQLEINDEIHRKSRICYEQIYSTSLSESERKMAMFHDLNTGIRNLYGAKAEFVKRVIPCYYLVRIDSENDFLKTVKSISELGTKMDMQLDMLRFTKSYYRATNSIRPYIFDQTEFHAVSKSIKIPDWKKESTFEELVTALNQYGFDLIEGEKEVDMILIYEY